MKKPVRHVLQYIALCLFLATMLALLIFFSGNPPIQKTLILLAGCFYVIWGYIHHYREGTLDLSIIVEYALYGTLGSFLVIGLL